MNEQHPRSIARCPHLGIEPPPLPISLASERDTAINIACRLITRLTTSDVIAVIPVLARYAGPAPSQLQSHPGAVYPFEATPHILDGPALSDVPPAG